MLGGGGRTETLAIEQTSDKITHNELTYNKVNSNNANKAINTNDYNNIENNNSNNIDKIYKINKIDCKNHNSNIDTYNNLVTKKNNTFIKTALLIVSWLFVGVLSTMIVYFTNTNNDSYHIDNKFIAAEKENTFDTTDGSTRLGDGLSESTAFQISTYADLVALATLINSDDADTIIGGEITYRTAYYKLMNDIETDTTTWTPIGSYTNADGTQNSNYVFSGHFNGGGHEIKFNSSISLSYSSSWIDLGLFGDTTNAVIEYLSVFWSKLNITSVSILQLGGIVGRSDSNTNINYCKVSGTLIATNTTYGSVNCGGISGYGGNINYSGNLASITAQNEGGSSDVYSYAGGISGENATISNCYNKGQIYAKGGGTRRYGAYAGGISGGNSDITNCFNCGDVDAYSYQNEFKGGISASGGTIDNSFSLGNLTYEDSSVSSGWPTSIWANVGQDYPYIKGLEDYTIIYKAGEGTGAEITEKYGMKILPQTANIPNYIDLSYTEPSGKVFDCWVDESGQTYQSGQQVTLTENLVLTAQWKVPYIDFNISLNANGGNAGTVTQLEVKQSVPQKTQFATNELPTRSGYTFNGYYTSQTNGTMYVNSAGQVVKTNTSDYLTQIPTLYAQWVANIYTIVFNSNGGQGGMESMSMTYNAPKNLTKNAYSRDNYTFIGWATTKERADSGQVDYVDEAQVNIVTTNNATITLYAVWQSNYVGITFNITTNVGVIFNVYDNLGNFVQQIYVAKGSGEQTISTQLLKGKTYTIRMSAFSTANITLDSINSMSGVSMSGRTLTITINESGNTITMNVSGYTFGNGIIV